MTASEKTTLWKFRFFAVWQEGKEVLWLKSMSAKGWHLKRVGFLSYEFEKGEPRDYEYTLDFRLEVREDMREYRGLIEDSGWQYLGHMGGWQYFRIEADKAAGAEIYSDTESLMGKYWRVVTILAISGLPLFIMFMSGSLNRPALTETYLIYVIYTLLALLVYSIFRTLLLIRRKQQNG